MTLRVSTGYRNKNLGAGRPDIVGHAVANTIAFVNSTSKITDSGSGLGSFIVGDELKAKGTTSNDGVIFKTTAVAANELTVTPAPTDESAGTYFSLAAAQGKDNGGLRDIFRNFVLRVYSGTQPASPDDAIPGGSVLLMEFTENGGTFVHGSPDNGLNFDDSASAAIAKAAAETWKSTALASGTAGFFRFCGNPTDTGAASTTLARIDGSCGTDNADLLLITTAIVASSVYYINNASFSYPLQYGL